jgi:hypothetical protein
MKTFNRLFVIAFLFISNLALGDIIPSNSHYVDLCLKITNLDEYPEIALLGYVKQFGISHNETYAVSSNECLTKGYSHNTLELFAVKKLYIQGKDTSKIDLPKDKNAVKTSISIDPYLGYVPDSNPLKSKEQYYKIVGFTDTTVVIYKWKEVSKFNNGRADITETFAFTGDVTKLSQKITTGIDAKKSTSKIELFPNPAQKNVYFKIAGNYLGNVSISIYSLDGKKVSSAYITKAMSTLGYEMQTDLNKGTYLVYFVLGEKTEWKKLIIQ